MSDEMVLNPEVGNLLVRTYRDGVAAMVGHDLVLEVGDWDGTATLDLARPDACQVAIRARAASLKVREGTGGAKPLTNKDVADIEKTLREKILQASRHPEISFVSGLVRKTDGKDIEGTIRGELTICGVSRPAEMHITGGADGNSWRLFCQTTVLQSAWGIKPYSAFFGTLKVKDAIEIALEARVPRLSA